MSKPYYYVEFNRDDKDYEVIMYVPGDGKCEATTSCVGSSRKKETAEKKAHRLNIKEAAGWKK